MIKPEKIGLDQIEKVMKSAEKDLEVAEKLLSIDEGHSYETAYTAMLHAGRAFVFIKASDHQLIFSIRPLLPLTLIF